jgi:hypothetical protein
MAYEARRLTVKFQIHDVEKDLTTVGFEPTPFRTGYGKESLIPAP